MRGRFPCCLQWRSWETVWSGRGSSDLKGIWSTGEVHFKGGVAKTQQSIQGLREQFLKRPPDGNSTLRTSPEMLLFFRVWLCVCVRQKQCVCHFVGLCIHVSLCGFLFFLSLFLSSSFTPSFPLFPPPTSVISPCFSKMTTTWHGGTLFYTCIHWLELSVLCLKEDKTTETEVCQLPSGA